MNRRTSNAVHFQKNQVKNKRFKIVLPLGEKCGRNWGEAKTIRPVNKNEPRTTRTTGQHLGKHVGQQARIVPLRAKYKGFYKTTGKIMRANRWGGPENRPGNGINLY